MGYHGGMEGYLPIEKMEAFGAFVRVADWAWRQVREWDRFAQDTVGKQLVRAADSVAANMAEGDGRYTAGDELHFLIIARGSARETRYFLERAKERGLLTPTEAEEQIRALETATRQLNALITYRRTHRVKEDPSEYAFDGTP